MEQDRECNRRKDARLLGTPQEAGGLGLQVSGSHAGQLYATTAALAPARPAEGTRAAAERLSLYDLDQSIPEARELAGILVAQTRKMEEAVKGMRDMKKDPTRVLEACKEINLIENQADTLTRKTMAMLFKRGNDPLHVMKWKEIIDFIETATDRAEDVANIIEGVVLEHA